MVAISDDCTSDVHVVEEIKEGSMDGVHIVNKILWKNVA